jgi:16S rRNA (uracil1498-N3)-methyltransferase
MRKHRFFVNENLAINTNVNLDSDISQHISRVLRLQISDVIYLFNDSGLEFSATIESINKNSVLVNITDISAESYTAPLQINLGQVLSKGEKMDLIIQKATELGVHSITPLYSERSIIKPVYDRTSSKLGHWQKIAIAASCQSWRNTVPEIYAAQNLSDWVAANQDTYKLLLSPHHSSQKISNLDIKNTVTILIGPEGGFSDAEINHAMQHNFMPIALGPRILRTETAGLATIAILQAMFGDL